MNPLSPKVVVEGSTEICYNLRRTTVKVTYFVRDSETERFAAVQNIKIILSNVELINFLARAENMKFLKIIVSFLVLTHIGR